MPGPCRGPSLEPARSGRRQSPRGGPATCTVASTPPRSRPDPLVAGWPQDSQLHRRQRRLHPLAAGLFRGLALTSPSGVSPLAPSSADLHLQEVAIMAQASLGNGRRRLTGEPPRGRLPRYSCLSTGLQFFAEPKERVPPLR